MRTDYYVVCLIIYACRPVRAFMLRLIGPFGGAKGSGYPES